MDNETLRFWSSVLGILVGLLALLGKLWEMGEMRKGKWGQGWFGRFFGHEMFQSDRVVGGAIGAGLGGLFTHTNLSAGPILFFMLLGAVLGGRDWRVLGTAVGAVIGCFVAGFEGGAFDSVDVGRFWGPKILWPKIPQWISIESRWWFAASFVPLGGLIGGKARQKTGAL